MLAGCVCGRQGGAPFLDEESFGALAVLTASEGGAL